MASNPLVDQLPVGCQLTHRVRYIKRAVDALLSDIDKIDHTLINGSAYPTPNIEFKQAESAKQGAHELLRKIFHLESWVAKFMGEYGQEAPSCDQDDVNQAVEAIEECNRDIDALRKTVVEFEHLYAPETGDNDHSIGLSSSTDRDGSSGLPRADAYGPTEAYAGAQVAHSVDAHSLHRGLDGQTCIFPAGQDPDVFGFGDPVPSSAPAARSNPVTHNEDCQLLRFNLAPVPIRGKSNDKEPIWAFDSVDQMMKEKFGDKSAPSVREQYYQPLYHQASTLSVPNGHPSEALPKATYVQYAAFPTFAATDVIESAREITAYFTKFQELPMEVRAKIYELVVVSGKAISPKLCTHSKEKIQFHDENQDEHNAVYRSMAVTLVSKEVRNESLQVFYNKNTFTYSADITTYLDHITHLGRFTMVHHVTFPAWFYGDGLTDKMLRGIHKVVCAHQKYIATAQPTYTRATLVNDPVYTAGGDNMYGIFFLLRKLSTPITAESAAMSPDETLTHEVVLHIPSKAIFTLYPRLEYLEKVATSLDIKLKFVEGAPATWLSKCGGLQFKWSRRYQGKVNSPSTTVQEEGDVSNTPAMVEELQKRIEKMKQVYESTKKPEITRRLYYRTACRSSDIVQWFDLDIKESDDEDDED
jgi:hypothetical protein